MSERVEFTVSNDKDGDRLDSYLANSALGLSRQSVQRLIRDGHVQMREPTSAVPQPLARASRKVIAGERIIVDVPEPIPLDLSPEPIPLDILYEDEYLAVINKPPGLCVHPTETRRAGTLVNALLYHLKDLSGISGILRPGIVHRLDQGTSGAIVVAKNDEAHLGIAEQFHRREVDKRYVAVIDNAPSWDVNEVDQPIGRDLKHRKRMMVHPKGRASQTTFKMRARHKNLGVVDAILHTGRTHQIRVHLRHCGCPVVNDNLYRSRPYQGILEAKILAYPGLLLHAGNLSLSHPAHGARLHIEAPLPEEFQNIISWITNQTQNEPSC